MKTESNNLLLSHDDWWFEKKYSEIGISSRWDWYLYNLHKKKGATYKQNVQIDRHVRKCKGNGGTTDQPSANPDNPKQRKPYIPTKYDINDLFDFNYKDVILCEPNEKFDNLYNLKFTHIFDDNDKNIEQEIYIEYYNELKENGNLEKINYIYKRLSTYIYKNHLGRKYVDGSVICNMAIMTSEYLKTNTFNYDYDFLNNIENYNNDFDYRFNLWLILQCFISKNKFHKKYTGDVYLNVNWWAICHLMHRKSEKDFKTKGQCSGFKNNNGKYIYRTY